MINVAECVSLIIAQTKISCHHHHHHHHHHLGLLSTYKIDRRTFHVTRRVHMMM